jgi:hypothetical protein
MFGKINAQKLHSPSGTTEAKRPIEDLTNNEGDDEERRKKVRVTPPVSATKKRTQSTKKKITKAEAKLEYLVTDTDLRDIRSSKVGGRLQYSEEGVCRRAGRRHGGAEGLKNAKEQAKLFGKKIAGKTLEQHRRAMGDKVGAGIHVVQWCVAARTSCTIEGCNIDVFRALVVPNAKDATPSLFGSGAPVVVASVTQGAAAIFGSTKVTGGTRQLVTMDQLIPSAKHASVS